METKRGFGASALLALGLLGLLWSQARADEPPDATYELVTVDASGTTTYFRDAAGVHEGEHKPPAEWTSTKLKVEKGAMVLVMPAGVVSINLPHDSHLQMVTPAGGQNELGLLEMQFGDGEVIRVGKHGLGKFVSGYFDNAPESGAIKFRIKGVLDNHYEMTGRYRVQVVVLPPFSP